MSFHVISKKENYDIDESEKVFQFTKANDTTVDMVIPAYG